MVELEGCEGATSGWCGDAPAGGFWLVPQGTYRSYEFVAFHILWWEDDFSTRSSVTNGAGKMFDFIQLCEDD
jgi:hypothetical protein